MTMKTFAPFSLLILLSTASPALAQTEATPPAAGGIRGRRVGDLRFGRDGRAERRLPHRPGGQAAH